MNIFSNILEEYAAQHTEKEPELLTQLRQDTEKQIGQAQMLSGHYQGRLLSFISKLLRPKYIVEVGTFTGYATLCLAEGISPEGFLHTIDLNQGLASFQQHYFGQSLFKNQIKQHFGKALEIIPTLPDGIDLAFIDADKRNYPNYFDLLLEKMQKGGIIISDNVLWKGKVLNPEQDEDKRTQVLINYNKKLAEDPRVETFFLPIRDGLSFCYVK